MPNLPTMAEVNEMVRQYRLEMSSNPRRIPKKQEIRHIIELVDKWGKDKTLGEILTALTSVYKYKCPVCNGTGIIITHVPEYLGMGGDGRDVGCHDAYDREDDCELCNGIGYTEVKYVPHMVQDGWEPENKSKSNVD